MYQSFYGLTGKPFQLTPDPAFFFGSRGHSRAMAYLKYGVHQAEGFIVITGEVGAGKTTLVRNLLRQLPTKQLVAVQIVSTQLDSDDMLRMIAGAFFGVSPELPDKAALLMGLERFFRRLHAEGKRALLVVDEAQNLTPHAVEELRMLSNFQHNDKSLLQSLLLGQPEFRQMMQHPEMRQLRQRVTASAHLGPLDSEETQSYIEHRLHLVGWNGSPTFEPAAYQDIHDFSGGIPRQINVLCDRLLLAGFLGEKTVLTSEDVREVFNEFGNELGGARTSEEVPNSAQPVGEAASSNVTALPPIALAQDSEAVLLAGLIEQVNLLKESAASTARVLEHLTRTRRPRMKTIIGGGE